MRLSRCGQDSGPYPDETCQGTQAYLEEDGEEAGEEALQSEVAFGPHSANPHEGPAWACMVSRKFPSCLWEEGEESTTHPCISSMQRSLQNMHYYSYKKFWPFSHMNLQALKTENLLWSIFCVLCKQEMLAIVLITNISEYKIARCTLRGSPQLNCFQNVFFYKEGNMFDYVT